MERKTSTPIRCYSAWLLACRQDRGCAETAFVAGQVAVDKEGKLVDAGDLIGADQAGRDNLIAALAGVGAKPSDIVK